MRRWIEHGLHAVAIAAMVVAAVSMLFGQGARPGGPLDASDLSNRLQEWTRFPPSELSVRLDRLPDAQDRAWLNALHAAGTEVVWGNSGAEALPPLGLAVEPVADPHQPMRIWAALGSANAGEVLERLSANPMVTEPVASLQDSATLIRPSLAGAVLLQTPQAEAVANRRDSLTLKPLLLLGHASWEARFTAAALEEHGWQVDARLVLSPEQVAGQMPAQSPQPQAAQARGGRDATARAGAGRGGAAAGGTARGGAAQGAPEAISAPVDPGVLRPEIDIENYSAVLLLDETATEPAEVLAAYVESGGGLLAFADATDTPGLATLLPAQASGVVEEAQPFQDVPGAQDTGAGPARNPRDRLELHPLTDLVPAAHVLERRGESVAVAIVRRGDGRVAQVGYADIWRWQMSAPDETAPEAYRAWLAGLVSSVAHAPRGEHALLPERALLADSAPLAAWHAAFGPPQPGDLGTGDRQSAFTPDERLFWLLFALAGAALLAEWLLRRLRNLA